MQIVDRQTFLWTEKKSLYPDSIDFYHNRNILLISYHHRHISFFGYHVFEAVINFSVYAAYSSTYLSSIKLTL